MSITKTLKTEFCVSPVISIESAIIALKKSGYRCLVIVSKKNELLGTLTDGDLRNAILKGANLKGSIRKLYNRRPKFVDIKKYNPSSIRNLFIKNKIDLIPIIEKKKIKKIITWNECFLKRENLSNVSAFILAGGKGTRLQPFTNVLPKPLIPIKGEPIIKMILSKFEEYEIYNYWISINFKSEIIKSYLKSVKIKGKINFVKEKKPLGTIGSLSLVPRKKLSDNIIISNCDVLIHSNYFNIYQHHIKKNLDMTVLVSHKNYRIPYGSCKITNSGMLKKIKEKPEYKHFVNIGFYVMKKSLAKFIPKNTSIGMNDFINLLKRKRKKIGVYPIEDFSWQDIGEWNEYQKTISIIN
jgi:dTDP-glucose pyrophosphorylase